MEFGSREHMRKLRRMETDALEVRRRRTRRAAADAARISGPQGPGAVVKWDPDTALTPPQRDAMVRLAGEIGDGLIEYGAADVRTQRGDMGDVTVFVTELRDGATKVYLLDEEGGRHNA